MAFGVLSGRPVQRRKRMAMSGTALGATVPANCWQTAGFDDCNAQGWNQAETACRVNGQPTDLANQNFGGDVDACKQAQADDYAYYGCALRLCPPPVASHPTSSGGWTWMNTTPNASVMTFQQHLNQALQMDGYNQITADGKLGPATCGAFNFVGGNHPDLFASDPIANIGVCQSFTNPSLVGTTTPVPSPVSAAALQLNQQYGGLPWMQSDARAPSLQSQINVQLAANGFLPIPVSGMLDAQMCGAMAWLDQNTGTQWMASWGPTGGGACPSSVPPTPNPVGPGPAPAPDAGGGGAAPAPATSSSGFSSLGVGILAAALVAGAAYWKHKAG